MRHRRWLRIRKAVGDYLCIDRRTAGFTLVELLITSAILIILSAATLVGINVSTTERQLDQAVEALSLAVTTAQGFALAPPVDKTLGNAGYRLVLITDPNQSSLATGFEIHEIGSLPGHLPVVVSDALVRQGNFPTKIGFRLTDGGPLPGIVFSIPAQGDIIEPDTQSGFIRLEAVTRRGGGPSRRITISTVTGQIDVAL